MQFDHFNKGGRHFFKLQEWGGEAKSKPATEFPEHVFTFLIAWSPTKFEVLCDSLLYLLATIGSRDLSPHLAPESMRDSIIHITAHAQLISPWRHLHAFAATQATNSRKFSAKIYRTISLFSGKIIKEGMTQNVLCVLGHQWNISPTLGRIDHMLEWQATVILQIGWYYQLCFIIGLVDSHRFLKIRWNTLDLIRFNANFYIPND